MLLKIRCIRYFLEDVPVHRVVQSYWEYVNVIWKRPLTQKCGKFQSGVGKENEESPFLRKNS